MSSPVALLIIATQQSSGRGHRSWGASWGATVATDAWDDSWGTAATAVVGGTVSGDVAPDATEQEIRDGGQKIIITITNDSWQAAGSAFDDIRQDIINGLDAATTPASGRGWNDQVRDKEVVGSVVRTSDKIVTITLSAVPLYDIEDFNETITVTIPASALVASASAVVATPTFDITPIFERRFGASPRSRVTRREQWWELPDGRQYFGTRRAMADVVRDLLGEPETPTEEPKRRKRVTVVDEVVYKPVPVYIPTLDTSAIEAARARAEREIALSREREAAARLTYEQWEDEALFLLLMSS